MAEVDAGQGPAVTPTASVTAAGPIIGRLPLGRLIAFATPTIPLAAMLMPVTAYLPKYYARDLGVSLGDLAWAFMVVRFFDLWFDPALGLVMDRTNTRWGRFRPWFVAGAPLAMLATYMLFMAQPGVSALYILGWLLVGYAGQSMGQLGHMAWAATVAPSYDERSRVYGWWQAMTVVGMITILLLPVVIQKGFGGDFSDGVHAMGWFTIVMLPVTAIIALLSTGEPAIKPHHEEPKLIQYWQMIRRGSVLRVLLADICWGTALSLSGTLLFFFFESVRGIDDAVTGLMLIAFFLGALVGAPIWRAAARRIGKHRALTFAGFMWAVMQVGILVTPSWIWLGFLIMFLAGIPFAAGQILLKAMMADVADEERLTSGVDRTGLLFSLLTGSIKIGSMLAVGGSLYLLQVVGFDAKLAAGNSDTALLTLQLMFALGPGALALAAALIISRHKLDAAAHAEIRRRLDERDAAYAPPPV